MYTLSLLALAATLSNTVLAQQFVHPPDSSQVSNNQNNNLSWSIGQTINVEWKCNWQNINLVLWNDAQASDGSEWILRLIQNGPNNNNYSLYLGDNISLNNGSRFHLEVIEVDPTTGQESQNLIDSESFNIVSGNAAATTAVTTAAGTAASATATGEEKAHGQGDNQNAQATAAPYEGMSESSKVGLGVGLGLGLPLVIAAVVLGWWLLHRRHRAEKASYVYSGLGTAVSHQDPLPADPRSKSDPYDFVHQGQVAPVEKDDDSQELRQEPQEIP